MRIQSTILKQYRQIYEAETHFIFQIFQEINIAQLCLNFRHNWSWPRLYLGMEAQNLMEQIAQQKLQQRVHKLKARKYGNCSYFATSPSLTLTMVFLVIFRFVHFFYRFHELLIIQNGYKSYFCPFSFSLSQICHRNTVQHCVLISITAMQF